MDDYIFGLLIDKCADAIECAEVPVAAALVFNNDIVGISHNLRNISNNVFDHAEIIVISEYARKIGNWHLNDCDLYVTIEPCDMCKLFIRESRIRNVYYLLPRSSNKYFYNKTKFSHFTDYLAVSEYKKMLDLFWKSKR